jgi:hypothetical protein
MNDRCSRCVAASDFTFTRPFSRCERAQQYFDTSGVGSDLPFAALCAKVCFGLEAMTDEA